MTAACHNCVPPCFYDANLGVEHFLNCSARSLKINAILWTLAILILNTKIVLPNHSNDSDNHSIASPFNCPNESDSEGRKYLSEDMMHSEMMLNELRDVEEQKEAMAKLKGEATE